MTSPTTLLLLYVLFTVTYTSSEGFYTAPVVISMLLILLIMTTLRTSLTRYFAFQSKPDFSMIARVSLVLMTFLGLSSYTGYAIANHLWFDAGAFFQAGAAASSLLFLVRMPDKGLLKSLWQRRVLLFLGFIIMAKASIIFSSPAPGIDVFHLVKQSGANLLHGINPYDYSYDLRKQAGYMFDHFNYLPVSFLAPLPFLLALGDIRFSFLVFDLLSAWGMYLLARKAFAREALADTVLLIPLIFLANPLHSMLLESAWVEPIMVVLLVLFAVFFNRDKLSTLAPIFLGLLMGTKQYVFVSLPLLLRLAGWRLRDWLLAGFSAAVVILPFYIWSPKDFIADLVVYYLQYPARYDAATVLSLLHNEFPALETWMRASVDNFYIAYAIVLLPAAAFLVFTLMTQKRSLSSFFSSLSFMLLAFFLFSKMGFVNYDYLIGSTLLLSIVTGQYDLEEDRGIVLR